MTDDYRADWQNPHTDTVDEFTPAQVAAPIGGAGYAAAPLDRDYSGAHVGSTESDQVDEDDQGKAAAAKEQAAAVGQGAAQAGQQVAAVAKDQAQNVASEAGSQAKDLLAQARSELTEQAGTQQQRLTETLRALGAELESMADHDGDQGPATDLVRQAASRTHDAASWLDTREPGQILGDVQGFARQRPGAFLALAAAAGLVAGRLGRGVKDAGSDDSAAGPSTGATVTRTAAPSAAPTHEPAMVDLSVVEPRPFASSQVEDYPSLRADGEGL